jgi:hypothetical protein
MALNLCICDGLLVGSLDGRGIVARNLSAGRIVGTAGPY